MIPDLTPRDILKYKKDTLRSGINGFEEIKALQLDQLEDAVTKELHTYQDRFDARMKKNPDYKYPQKYADNHFGYWENGSYNYQDCVKILNLIREYRQGNIDSVPPEQPDSAQEQEQTKGFDPGRFNGLTHKLFLYLVDNYKKKGKVKYTNIFYFLIELADDKPNLLFNFTQREFTVFIENKFGVKLTKYKKAEFAYLDKEKPVLRNCTDTFFKSL